MPFMTTPEPTDHGIETMRGCLFPMFSERLLTPGMLAQWTLSERHEMAQTILSSWSPPHQLLGGEFALVRNLLMVNLCMDNACHAGAHVQLKNEAVSQAKEESGRVVYTVSMPYNKAGPYMGHCNTHTVTTQLQCTPYKFLIRRQKDTRHVDTTLPTQHTVCLH